MRYWQTSDGPTNANLDHLENLARPWRGITVDHFMDRIRSLIGIEKMLPQAVRRHFNLPPLYLGNAPHHWSSERLVEKTQELCDALEAGLASAHVDPALQRAGNADLSDRPATRGEEIAEALDAYRRNGGSAELSTLRQACYGTRLTSHIEKLDRWLNRKRPSSPDRSIAYEIACVLGDIGREASDLHHEPASWRYAEMSAAGRAQAQAAAQR